MSNQRSILSFFSSNSSAPQQSKPTLPPQHQATPPQPPPPPPPSVLASRYAPPPGMTLRTGGSPTPQLSLPPISPQFGRSMLVAAGAQAAQDIVFPSSTSSTSSTSSSASSPTIVFPRAAHVPGLVSVNAILLPVRYPDSFYNVVADSTRLASLFNRVILGDDGQVVGGVVCRLDATPFGSAPHPSGSGAPAALAVYIQSLALSSPYRGRGLMAAALQSIVATVQALNRSATSQLGGSPILSLYAHVWTESDDALRWYAAHGFARQGAEPVANYYFKLQPNTAWIVRRDVADAAPGATTAAAKQLLQAKEAQKDSDTVPPPRPDLSRTASSVHSQSYQNARPQTEWNDLPMDMVVGAGPVSATASRTPSVASSRSVSRINLTEGAAAEQGGAETGEKSDNGVPAASLPPPPPSNGSLLPPPSTASSRSNSIGAGRKKRERSYPAAMFQ